MTWMICCFLSADDDDEVFSYTLGLVYMVQIVQVRKGTQTRIATRVARTPCQAMRAAYV
jgi:hypothetical protein